MTTPKLIRYELGLPVDSHMERTAGGSALVPLTKAKI